MKKTMQREKHKHESYVILILPLLIAGGIFVAYPASAAQDRPVDLRVFNAAGERSKSFRAFAETFRGGASVSVGDVDGDASVDYVVGTGPEVPGEVRVFNGDGRRITSFFPYGRGFRRGVNVATADLDGDARADIITAPMSGSPHVRVFNGSGEAILTPGFFAFDKKFRGGANVAAGDVTGDGIPDIVAGAGPGGGGHVRIFNRYGVFSGFSVFPFGADHHGGVDVAIGDVDGDGTGELITSVARYGEPRVKVYDVDRSKTILGYFLAFPKSHRGGVDVAAADLDGDGRSEIIVGVSAVGGPQVIVYDGSGRLRKGGLFTYERTFRGGVRLAAADVDGDRLGEIIVVPSKTPAEGRTDLFRYIDIDISEQRLRYYEAGVRLGEHVISTGKWSMPTPIGTHAIRNHILTAYSRPYDLYMDYWMAITPDGSYGIHALPYWKLAGGGRKYEGEDHLGKRVSHGCIRQSMADAKKLFEWASVGTPVIVHD